MGGEALAGRVLATMTPALPRAGSRSTPSRRRHERRSDSAPGRARRGSPAARCGPPTRERLRRPPEIVRSAERPFPLRRGESRSSRGCFRFPRGESGHQRREARRGSDRDRLAGGSGRGPFRQGARAASQPSHRPRCAGEIELPGEQRFVGGNLLSSGRGEDVVADRDHHAGDVGARRRQMGEKGCGEGTIAALAVESDIVGLGREGDEEPGKLADTRQSGRGQAIPALAKGLLRHASRKTTCTPLPLPSSASTAIERNHPRGEVVDLGAIRRRRARGSCARRTANRARHSRKATRRHRPTPMRIRRWRAAWPPDRDQP